MVASPGFHVRTGNILRTPSNRNAFDPKHQKQRVRSPIVRLVRTATHEVSRKNVFTP